MFEFLAGWLQRRKKDGEMEARVEQAIADENVCTVLRLVLENPGISAEKIAARAEIGVDTILRCLRRLAEAGLVEKGPDTGYSVAAGAKAAVVKFLPLNYQCPGLLR